MVETIDFDEDEDAELPLPMTQKDVILINKAGPYPQEEPGEPGKEGEAEAAEAAAQVHALLKTSLCFFALAGFWSDKVGELQGLCMVLVLGQPAWDVLSGSCLLEEIVGCVLLGI